MTGLLKLLLEDKLGQEPYIVLWQHPPGTNITPAYLSIRSPDPGSVVRINGYTMRYAIILRPMGIAHWSSGN